VAGDFSKLQPDVVDEECTRVLAWLDPSGVSRLNSDVDYTIAVCFKLGELCYKAFPSTNQWCQVINVSPVYGSDVNDVECTLRACLGGKAVSVHEQW
jgi:hypothetical protein